MKRNASILSARPNLTAAILSAARFIALGFAFFGFFGFTQIPI